MFLKIRCGQTTTIYEIDDIEYFSFSWYDFVDLEKKQTKEYLENIELLDKQQGKDPLYFVKQKALMQTHEWSQTDGKIDRVGIRKLLDLIVNVTIDWLKPYNSSEQIPVLLYLSRVSFLLHPADMENGVPHIFFIKLKHKNPDDDIIILTDMNNVYLQSDSGKTIEKLSKREKLCESIKIDLKNNYFTEEWFKERTQRDKQGHKVYSNSFFPSYLYPKTDNDLTKKIKEYSDIDKKYQDAIQKGIKDIKE